MSLLGNLRDLLGERPASGWACPPPEAPPSAGGAAPHRDPNRTNPPTPRAGPTTPLRAPG
jgi:hypothetical protein